ncbi:MAG: hypothetical protein ACTS3F_07960 [Phycisphaerales bacterium]
MALAFPLLCAAASLQCSGSSQEMRLALVLVSALPSGMAMLSAALLCLASSALASREGVGTHPRNGWIRTPPLVFALVLVVVAGLQSLRLGDAQAIGLLGIAWWWRTSMSGGMPGRDRAAPESRRAKARSPHWPIAIASLGMLMAGGHAVIASLAGVLWIIGGAWAIGRDAQRTGMSHARGVVLGAFAGGMTIGLGLLGTLETARVVVVHWKMARMAGVDLAPGVAMDIAVESLGAGPMLHGVWLLGVPAVALAALSVSLPMRATRHPDHPTRESGWPARLLAGAWTTAAAAVVSIPLGIVLRGA